MKKDGQSKEIACQMINYTFNCPGCGKTHEIVIEYGDNAFRCACRHGINLKLLFDNNGEAVVKIEKLSIQWVERSPNVK